MKKTTIGIAAAVIGFISGGLLEYKWMHRKPPVYTLENVRECARCHKLLSIRAGLRLIQHLMDDHGYAEDNAIDMMNEMFRRMKKCLSI